MNDPAPDDPWFDRVLHMMANPGEQLPGDPALCTRLAEQGVPPADYQPAAAAVTDAEADGPHGPVAVRVYRPADPAASQPAALVWCHGGAWAAGDLDMPEADAVAREIANRAGATVVSVGYRLALRGVWFPVPLDDVIAALRWTVASAAELGIDPARVSLGGASAGANLAAGAALRLKDEGGPVPAALLLAYPCLHPLLPPPSEELAPKVAALTPAMAFAPEILTPLVENYLGGPVTEATKYAMPGLADADDLAGLPPTLILNAEYDALRSSGEAFAATLDQAGLEVLVRCEPDVAHGHLNSPWLPAADASLATMAAWVAASPGGAR